MPQFSHVLVTHDLCLFESCTGVSLFINPFTPEILKWILPSLNLDMFIGANRGFGLKNRMANDVDPDESARYESSDLDLYCLCII